MSDVLKDLKPQELVVFYGRIADVVERNLSTVKVSLAAMFIRQWLKNRDSNSTFAFEAPEHLKNNSTVREVQDYHRKVFLTQEQARLEGGTQKWAGIVPRLLGQAPYAKLPMQRPVAMGYESLVALPLHSQISRDDGDKDIFYSLHHFQLHSDVMASAAAIPGKKSVKIHFQSYNCYVWDYYDWNKIKHIKVPNPDFGSTAPGAITPKEKIIDVYHQNALRVEAAGLAAPFKVESKPWQVNEARLFAPVEVEVVL